MSQGTDIGRKWKIQNKTLREHLRKGFGAQQQQSHFSSQRSNFGILTLFFFSPIFKRELYQYPSYRVTAMV